MGIAPSAADQRKPREAELFHRKMQPQILIVGIIHPSQAEMHLRQGGERGEEFNRKFNPTVAMAHPHRPATIDMVEYFAARGKNLQLSDQQTRLQLQNLRAVFHLSKSYPTHKNN